MARAFRLAINVGRKIGIAILVAIAWWLTTTSPSFAQVGTTVLPSELVPIPGQGQSVSPSRLGQDLELRIFQKLPSSFYFNSSTEGTFRIETNPFQFPPKRAILMQEVPPGSIFADLTTPDQLHVLRMLKQVNAFDNVNRINPNVTAGWSPDGKLQIFANYFFLRDSLLHNSVLNSNTQSVGPGIQYNFNFGKSTLQPQYTMRELWQTGQPPVFDCLPAITLQTQVTPNALVYLNAVLQVRFKHFLGGPMRELDPFYTAGFFYQKGGWSFSATGTFLQNFRKPFGKNALLPVNNYSFVCDFEIDRQVSKRLPGLVTLVRAEPVFNFASHATPGISGFDFRLYYGFRLSMSKPPLTGTIQQLKDRYKRRDQPQQQSVLPNAALLSTIHGII